MREVSGIRLGVVATVLWPMFWAMIFARWFYFSPLGLIIVFGLPIVCWVLWWNVYRDQSTELTLGHVVDPDDIVRSLHKLATRMRR